MRKRATERRIPQVAGTGPDGPTIDDGESTSRINVM
jgi:hypothetical protein